MKKLIVLTSLVLAVTASAGLDNGIYRGTTAQGTSCEISAKGVSFRNNLKHPVNEQVTVEYNGETFILGHLASLNNNNNVQIQGEFLTGFNGIQGGVTALQLAMVHSEAYHGPKEFHFVAQMKDSSLNQTVVCQDLKFVE